MRRINTIRDPDALEPYRKGYVPFEAEAIKAMELMHARIPVSKGLYPIRDQSRMLVNQDNPADLCMVMLRGISSSESVKSGLSGAFAPSSAGEKDEPRSLRALLESELVVFGE